MIHIELEIEESRKPTKMAVVKDTEKHDSATSEFEDISVIKTGANALDDAGKSDYSGAVGKTDEKEIRLVRKLDWHIMPALWAMYFLNYLDRNAIAQARLNNLEKDLKLVGSQYNTCISILFVG